MLHKYTSTHPTCYACGLVNCALHAVIKTIRLPSVDVSAIASNATGNARHDIQQPETAVLLMLR